MISGAENPSSEGPEDEQGVEKERTDVPSGLPEIIDSPFDPQQIKISRRVVPVDLIVKRIEFKEIELAPDFQRRARIWDIVRKSKLIESMLLRIPLPVFYVAADAHENWRVVDGLQRLTTISDFKQTSSPHSFALRGLEYLSSYEGATFDQLPRSIKRRIDETELNINVIESGTPDEVMFNVFKRINTGGITLNGQEIRHALNPGPARDFLSGLAESKEFQSATTRSVSDERMAARELVLRFSAFSMTPPAKYIESDLDGFLNEAMRKINKLNPEERDFLAEKFKIAMTRANSIFGRDAFRKRFRPEDPRSPINRALFEAWSVPLARLSDDEFRLLESRREELCLKFQDALMDSETFLNAISVSTGSRARVVERFSEVESLIRRTLNDH